MPFTEKLAEHFMVDHKNFIIDVQGGGSTAGIQAVINNTVDLGMSSRALKEGEKTLNTITICHDGSWGSSIPKPRLNWSRPGTPDLQRRYLKWSHWVGRTGRKMRFRERKDPGPEAHSKTSSWKGKEINDPPWYRTPRLRKEVVATDPYAIGYNSKALSTECETRCDRRSKPP